MSILTIILLIGKRLKKSIILALQHFFDEFINNFLNGFRNNQTDKSPDAWFNNDQTFYEQLKRKYKYTTDDKKGMMLDIIIKEIKKEKKISSY